MQKQPDIDGRVIISSEEALVLLNSEVGVENRFLKIFGEENFGLVRNLMKREDILYLEFLNFSGQMNADEMNDYLMILDDFHKLRVEIDQAAKLIAKNLTKKIHVSLQRAITGTRDGGFKINFIKSISNLLVSIDNSLKAFALVQPGYEECMSLIQSRLSELRVRIHDEIGHIVYKYISEKYPKNVQDTVVFQASIIDNMSDNDNKTLLPLGASLKLQWNFIACGKRPQLQVILFDIVKGIDSVESEEELSNLFDRVNVLSYNRQIENHVIDINDNLKIEFYLDEDINAQFRPYNLCLFDLEINGKHKLSLAFDRSSKELRLREINYSLARMLDNKILYSKMKKFILDHLYEYLSSKDEDYVRVSSASPKATVSAVKFELKNIVNKKSEDAVAAEVALETELERSLMEDFDVSSSGDMPIVDDLEEFSVPDCEGVELDGVELPDELQKLPDDNAGDVDRSESVKRKVRVTLRGLSGNVVKGALIRLLGPPVWVSGSHNVFEGRDGIRFPMPFHGKEPVGTGILIACLKRFGISKREFYEEVRGKLKG